MPALIGLTIFALVYAIQYPVLGLVLRLLNNLSHPVLYLNSLELVFSTVKRKRKRKTKSKKNL